MLYLKACFIAIILSHDPTVTWHALLRPFICSEIVRDFIFKQQLRGSNTFRKSPASSLPKFSDFSWFFFGVFCKRCLCGAEQSRYTVVYPRQLFQQPDMLATKGFSGAEFTWDNTGLIGQRLKRNQDCTDCHADAFCLLHSFIQG